MFDGYTFQYVVGGLVFLLGILFAVRSGVIAPRTAIGRKRLAGMVLGLVCVASVQGFFEFIAWRW